ncbi:MAG TPA: DUF6429 family protein [Candidatus Limnocylindria bacterium]|jgi:hypothetical protein|nr:DUF6429 family protein [Candidatus Limnocylindria bacterium]
MNPTSKAPEPNLEKIDEAVLALLYLTSTTAGEGDFATTQAWKSMDWAAMDRLFKKGFIGDPKSKAKSVSMSPEGIKTSRELFQKLFCD